MMPVGPVIQASALGRAVVESLVALNPEVTVIDRGSYFRVLVPGRCLLTRAAVESRIGADFQLPGDLELVMSSFQGHLQMSDSAAEWTAPNTPEGRA